MTAAFIYYWLPNQAAQRFGFTSRQRERGSLQTNVDQGSGR
jgi:hypothetical protein